MARKKTRPVRVEAAYDAHSRALCPLCYSRPSVAGRQKRDVETRSRGWGSSTVEKIVRHEGNTYGTVSQIRYPCSNPTCLAEIIVEWYGNSVGAEGHAHLLRKHQLKGADAKRYEAGSTDGQGVWHETPTEAFLASQEVAAMESREHIAARGKRKTRSDKGKKRTKVPQAVVEPTPTAPKKRGKKSTTR